MQATKKHLFNLSAPDYYKKSLIKMMLLALFFIFPQVTSAQITHYVSPTGDDNSGDGSALQPWRKIRYAVNHSSSGDIIKVMDDNNEATNDYIENITIDKKLIIERYNNIDANPQIKSYDSSHVFIVTADSVTIKGLDIYGAIKDGKAGICLNNVFNCTIQDNRCGWGNWDSGYSNNCGIYSFSSSQNNITNNFCLHDGNGGIILDSLCIENTISGNICRNTSNWGVNMRLHYSDKNKIKENDCSDGSSDIGIKLKHSHENTILDNNFSEHIDHTSIFLDSSNNNTISNNDCSITSNSIILISSNDNTITENKCALYGYSLSLRNSSNNIIYMNNFISSLSSVISSYDSSTNIWCSPAELNYRYNGASYTNYLGNYYNKHDLTDSNGDGITDSTYNLPGDEPDDNYSLAATIDNYSINPVSVEFPSISDPNLKGGIQLKQNYPNPFNPSTMIKYQLATAGHVVMTIYNLAGQEVAILVNKIQPLGEYEVTWQPKGLPSGLYFYKLQVGDYSVTKKLLLQK